MTTAVTGCYYAHCENEIGGRDKLDKNAAIFGHFASNCDPDGVRFTKLYRYIDQLTGSIEVGKAADMIITRDNPLVRLHALRNVSMVIKEGALIAEPKVKKKSTSAKKSSISSYKKEERQCHSGY